MKANYHAWQTPRIYAELYSGKRKFDKIEEKTYALLKI